MGRTIAITKVGACTKIVINDTDAHNETRYYNGTCDFYLAGSTLVICSCGPHSELRIQHSEISTKLGTANIDAYADEIIKPANGFFNANVVL